MSIANEPILIDDGHKRHAPQLKDIDLLFITFCDNMRRVRKTNKWDLLLIPIRSKSVQSIGANGENLCAAARKFCVIIAQARQLRAAIWS